MRFARLQRSLLLLLWIPGIALSAQTIQDPLQTPAAQAACGPMNAKILASTTILPAQPPPGMARVYVITYSLGSTFSHTPATRIGMDGKWIGRSPRFFYHAVDVTPGVHHFCAVLPPHGSIPVEIMLGINMHAGTLVALAQINAKLGQTYYLLNRSVGADILFTLQPVDQDEANMFLAAQRLSTSPPSP